MRNHFSIPILSLLLVLGLFAGCSSDASHSSANGTLNVRMTDDPGDFESVNLVITEVSAHVATSVAESDTDSTSGWVVLNSTPATYDLLTLRNGVFVTIGTGLVPAGHYTQVRLKLGTGSTVVVAGVSHPLTVPSGLQSGLKLVGPFDVPAGGAIDIALDFDAARSVILNGAGAYMLKPTVKVIPISASGGITGQVAPAGTEATIYALQPPDTLGSTSAAADGHFTLAVLAPGVYSVAFDPAAGFRDTTIAGVTVTTGATTNVGTVTLTPQ